MIYSVICDDYSTAGQSSWPTAAAF